MEFIRRIAGTKFYRSIRHHWLTIVFLLGFATDYFLLNQVDNKIDDAILFFYVMLASVSLILYYVGVAEKASPRLVRIFNKSMPLLIQYSFGGLLSGMLIFYGRSGDLLVSAPFLIIIGSVVVANEVVNRRANRLVYNLAVYFIGLFSYLVLMVPVVLGQMGKVIFVGSGLLALALVTLLVQVLALIIPNYIRLEKRWIVFSIGSLYALFNGLYFFNIIPPIPLSLTELSIYQRVEKTSLGGYRIVKEEPSWYERLPFWPTVFRPAFGHEASCFARVYTPTNLATNIVHRWDYKDPELGWVNYFKWSYPISWENKNGYRGYTKTENLKAGEWRCTVETEQGQVLGRLVFTVDLNQRPRPLVTVIE